MKKRLLILCVVLACLISFHFIRFLIVRSKLNEMGPKEVVETYYKSLQRKDLTTARSCWSDRYASGLSFSYNGFNTILYKNISIGEAYDIPLHGENGKEVQSGSRI